MCALIKDNLLVLYFSMIGSCLVFSSVLTSISQFPLAGITSIFLQKETVTKSVVLYILRGIELHLERLLFIFSYLFNLLGI